MNAQITRPTRNEVQTAYRAACNAEYLIAGARDENEARDLTAEADRLRDEYRSLAAARNAR